MGVKPFERPDGTVSRGERFLFGEVMLPLLTLARRKKGKMQRQIHGSEKLANFNCKTSEQSREGLND